MERPIVRRTAARSEAHFAELTRSRNLVRSAATFCGKTNAPTHQNTDVGTQAAS